MASTEWVGVISTTAPKFLKGASDNTIRDRILLAYLQKKGRIMFGQSSFELNWQAQRSLPPVESYADGATLNFSRHDLWERLTLDWRGYKATDMMTDKERLMNAGTTQLIDRYAKIIPNLTRALQDGFGTELYIDGTAAGNENRLVGLESIFALGTTAAGDIIGQPSTTATYAGKAYGLGAFGGSWSTDLSTKPNSTIATDWPYGTGTTEYDFLTPKVANTSSTGWGTGSTTWEDNCERAIREMVSWLTIGGGKVGMPDLILLNPSLYTGFLNHMSAKQRVMVPSKEADDLGFGDTVNFDGVAVTREYGIGAGVGYAINADEVELDVLGDSSGGDGEDSLFRSRGPDYIPFNDAWMFQAGFYGNCKLSPKYLGKFKAVA